MTPYGFALGCLVLTLLAPFGARQHTFRSTAEGVRVDVLVTDGTRRVRGLSAADFEVRDNGVVQQITQLEVERIPLNVIAVFDASDSVRGERLRELVAAGRSLVDALRASDRVAIVSFATHVALPVPLTTDHERVRHALGELSPAGLTSLRDATFAGLALREADTSRTLMLVFSDGDDTASYLTAARVLDAAARSDLVVYGVKAPEHAPVALTSIIDKRPDAMQRWHPLAPPALRANTTPDEHGKFLFDLAAATGGSVAGVASDEDLTNTFTGILGEFRDRYVLSYSPTGVDDSGWHELSVKVKGKSLKVTARRGYYAQ